MFAASLAVPSIRTRITETIVFIEEQTVPIADEWDGMDDVSTHFLAERNDGTPAGCARLMPDGQIGRLAVLEAERRQGIGRQLMEAVIEFESGKALVRFIYTLSCMPLSSMNRLALQSRVMCSGMPAEHVPMRLTRTANASPAL